MTVSFSSKKDAEKARKKLPPKERSKTKIVMQSSYYLEPMTNDDLLVNQVNHLVKKGDYNKAMIIADSISDKKRSLRAQAHVAIYLMNPQ